MREGWSVCEKITNNKVINIVIAGLGGQGVLLASDILADAAFRSGSDVKKSEIHGMSQRGGSVSSDVRFGAKVLSPMIPAGQADFLVCLSEDQVEVNKHVLSPKGVLISAAQIDENTLENKRSVNVALLGMLSKHLSISQEHWTSAIKAGLAEKLHQANLQAFEQGRNKN